jgi:hypothetical protein
MQVGDKHEKWRLKCRSVRKITTRGFGSRPPVPALTRYCCPRAGAGLDPIRPVDAQANHNLRGHPAIPVATVVRERETIFQIAIGLEDLEGNCGGRTTVL